MHTVTVARKGVLSALVLSAVLAIIIAFAALPTGAAAEQGCIANKVCGYTSPNFEGTRYAFDCAFNGAQGGAFMSSARNRCGSRSNTLQSGGSIIACMNPGGDRPNPGWFNLVYTFPAPC